VGADSDALDNSWTPRFWNSQFSTMSFMHNLQPWIFDETAWEIKFVEGATPMGQAHTHD
jgi:hypothetical protein